MATGRLIVICAAVGLMVVVVVNSASFQSADVITAHQPQQPCVSASSTGCDVRTSRHVVSASASAHASRHYRPRRQTDSAASNSHLTSDHLDEDRQERRAQQKSEPPKQNVSIHDKSVAEALAMAANVGRGPPPVPPKPSPAQPPMPTSSAKPAASGSRSGDKGTGSGDAVNVMLALGCEAEPCQNNGVCYTDAFSPRGFSCRCAAGYYGDVCEYGWCSVLNCHVRRTNDTILIDHTPSSLTHCRHARNHN